MSKSVNVCLGLGWSECYLSTRECEIVARLFHVHPLGLPGSSLAEAKLLSS